MAGNSVIVTSTDPNVDASFPKVTGTTDGVKHGLDVNVISGSITVSVGGSPLNDINWDACDVQQTSTTVRTYVFKTGGLAGTTVATCTLTYTDSTRVELDSVVWS